MTDADPEVIEPEYDRLVEFAERLSGRFALDFSAVAGQGVAELAATPPALQDVQTELEAAGHNVEVYPDDEPPRLLAHPRPGDLEPETGGGRDA